MTNSLFGSTILITGGTGTFGQAFLQHCLDSGAKEIRILSRDEKKQYDLMQQYPNQNVKFYLGDIRDKKSIERAMQKVDYVFHAAAMKQIPACESFPLEAVKTNVLGSENVLNTAIENKVKKVVCLSTDKAVYPISTMGLTKSLMEKIALAKAAEQTITEIYITRFSNLLISNGSVVPLFIKLAKNKQPLTVTNPEMTRFFIGIEEAMDLVEWAFYSGQNGEIITKASKSIRLGDLAEAIGQLYDTESNIKIIGARPGERQHESLISVEEASIARMVNDYIVLSSNGTKALSKDLYCSNYAESMSIEEIKEKIKKELKIFNI